MKTDLEEGELSKKNTEEEKNNIQIAAPKYLIFKKFVSKIKKVQ